jgi:hypothetical protein
VSDPKTPAIRVTATISSDDGQRTATFDATPWFETASDEEIANLQKRGWSDSTEADNVAYALQSENPEIGAVLDHARITRGFEVSIDSEAAEEFLAIRFSDRTAEAVDESIGTAEDDAPVVRVAFPSL